MWCTEPTSTAVASSDLSPAERKQATPWLLSGSSAVAKSHPSTTSTTFMMNRS